MKTIGLIGGISWESTAVYYRLLNRMARERLGGQHSAQLLLWSFDFAEIEELQARGAWNEATARMIDAARVLESGGAECLVICANTMHRVAGQVQKAVSLPLIHITDALAAAVHREKVDHPLLLGTRYTMEQDFYSGRLYERHGIRTMIPDEEDREAIHGIIYNELCRGVINPDSLASYLSIIKRNRVNGADSVIFGCTEIGLLIDKDSLDCPVFDTTEIHARAALDFALDSTMIGT
jgi:aspartate racemase